MVHMRLIITCIDYPDGDDYTHLFSFPLFPCLIGLEPLLKGGDNLSEPNAIQDGQRSSAEPVDQDDRHRNLIPDGIQRTEILNRL